MTCVILQNDMSQCVPIDELAVAVAVAFTRITSLSVRSSRLWPSLLFLGKYPSPSFLSHNSQPEPYFHPQPAANFYLCGL